MPYNENYEQQTRRRKLTNAVVPGQGLLTDEGGLPEGMDQQALSEFANRRAGELEKSYRAKDLEREMADIDSKGALLRRQEGHVGAANAERFIGEAPGRELEVREREWNAGPPHQRRLEELKTVNEGRLASPYLNYLGKRDATDASRERTRAQYGDPDAEAAEPKAGIFSDMLGGLFRHITGTKKPQQPDPQQRGRGQVQGPAAGPEPNADQEYNPENLVGQLKRAYPNASPRDLVAILNEEVDGDPEEMEAATRLLLGLGR